jgi:hypothetical protein
MESRGVALPASSPDAWTDPLGTSLLLGPPQGAGPRRPKPPRTGREAAWRGSGTPASRAA